MTSALLRVAANDAQICEDSALIRAYLRGDERAFAKLYERYSIRLLNFLWRMIGDRERAEDLMQMTFLRVYRHLKQFDKSKKFSTWLYAIASNLAKNELRNRSRDRLTLFSAIVRRNDDGEEMELSFEDPKNGTERLYEKRRLVRIVKEAIAALPENHRQVFVLREIDGKSYEEIAEITHSNLGTVKSRLNRSRNAFAAIVAPRLG